MLLLLLLLFFKKNASICCINRVIGAPYLLNERMTRLGSVSSPGELCKTRPDLNPEDVTAWSGIGEDKPGF